MSDLVKGPESAVRSIDPVESGDHPPLFQINRNQRLPLLRYHGCADT